jgi:hypothetical protein
MRTEGRTDGRRGRKKEREMREKERCVCKRNLISLPNILLKGVSINHMNG